MTLRTRNLFLVVTLAAMLVTPVIAQAAFNGVLSGEVRTNPPTSFTFPTRLIVTLRPQTGGSPGDIISQQYRIGGAPEPYKFTLNYAPSRIKPGLTYVLDVQIAVGSDGQYQKLNIPLSNGQLASNTITLEKASFFVPEGGAGTWLLLLGGVLAVLGGAVALWRRRQARALILQRA